MTKEQAKAFYMRYDGSAFQMGREDHEKYEALRALDLPDTVYKAWDEELLAEAYKNMKKEPENLWIFHGQILEILLRGHVDVEPEAIRLLYTLEHLPLPDEKNRTLILENMHGRGYGNKHCGCRLYVEKTKQADRMNRLMERFIEAGGESTPDRFAAARDRYREVYRSVCR